MMSATPITVTPTPAIAMTLSSSSNIKYAMTDAVGGVRYRRHDT